MNRVGIVFVVLVLVALVAIQSVQGTDVCTVKYCKTCTTSSKCNFYCKSINISPKYTKGTLRKKYYCKCCKPSGPSNKCDYFKNKLGYYDNGQCGGWCYFQGSYQGYYKSGYANGDGTCRCCLQPFSGSIPY